jgi:hypothetical protein
MAKWTFWDWVGFVSLGLAAFGMALGAVLKEDAEVIARLPAFLASPRWVYMPAILFTLGSIILAVRTLAPLIVKPTSTKGVERPIQDWKSSVEAAPSTQGSLLDSASLMPNYVGSIQYLGGAVGDGGTVQLAFKATNYLDRLRIFVEFSSSETHAIYPASWQHKYKILLDDLRDVPKGQQRTVPLIYEFHASGEQRNFSWGDPKVKPQDGTTWIGRSKNRARVIFVGPDNREQVYKIIVIKTMHDHIALPSFGSPVIGILDENEIKSALDWPDE